MGQGSGSIIFPGECAHLSSKTFRQSRIDVGNAGVFEETPKVTGLPSVTISSKGKAI